MSSGDEERVTGKSRRRDAMDEEENEDDRDGDRKRCHWSSHHHRDAEPEAAAPNRGEESHRRQQKKAEDIEAEQHQLDDGRLRAKDGQENKRRGQQQPQQDGAGGAAKATIYADGEGEPGKRWTLDGKESDEEDTNKSEENGGAGTNAVDVDGNSGAGTEEDEIDPLDAFMNSMVFPEVAAQALAAAQAAARAASIANQQVTAAGSLLPLQVTPSQQDDDATEDALDAATARNLARNLARIQGCEVPEHYDAELEINDFPQYARWKITHKDTLVPIEEWTGTAITTRGAFIPQGRIVGANERKLYLYVEGPTESLVKKAKIELKRVLEDCANHVLNLPCSAQT